MKYVSNHNISTDKTSIQRQFVEHAEFSLALTRSMTTLNKAASFQALALSYVYANSATVD